MAELNTLGAVIKQTYENETDTNAYTDAEKAKLEGISSIAMSGSFNDLTDVPELVVLDNSGTIPMQYLNVSSLAFKGAWDASTNTPSIVDGTGSVGDFYKVSIAGTHNFGNGEYIFAVGDWVMFAAGVWQRIGVHESIVTVNGKTGMVVLTAADVGAKPSTYVPTYAELTGKPDFANLYVAKTSVNAASGVAGVGSDNRVASANLPTYLPQRARVWVARTSERTHGEWYTNNSGNEMELFLSSNNANDGSYFNVQMRPNASGSIMSFISNSSASGTGLPSTRAFSNVTVPIGWQYSVNSSNIATRTITTWHELS